MDKIAKRVLHKEVRTVDLPQLAAKYGDNIAGLNECLNRIEEELRRIQKFPDREGKPCQFQPLSTAGFRKVKLFSGKALQKSGEKTDLRIIYRYDKTNHTVQVLTIGF